MKERVNINEFMNEFIKDRNEALFSLNEEKIKAYLKKYHVTIPESPKIFWSGVYKAIYNITDAPQELKEKAKIWLEENGMGTSIKR